MAWDAQVARVVRKVLAEEHITSGDKSASNDVIQLKKENTGLRNRLRVAEGLIDDLQKEVGELQAAMAKVFAEPPMTGGVAANAQSAAASGGVP